MPDSAVKICAACRETKPIDAFNRQASSKDGRYPYCKECSSARTKAAYRARGKKSWTGDKTCSWCRELKPRSAFRKDPAGKVAARCMACEADIAAHEVLNERRCNICREWLPLSRFYQSKLKFPNIACQECTRAQVAQPTYKTRRRERELRSEYGITLDQYKELLSRQGGKCPICMEGFEPGVFSYPVDHAHSGAMKGRIRAILHQNCNRFVMWMHEDSAPLRRAADLIDNPLTDWVVPSATFNERRRAKERNDK